MNSQDTSIFNTLPPIAWIYAVLLLAPELIFQFGENDLGAGANAIGWRIYAIRSFGFVDHGVTLMIERGELIPEVFLRALTYIFLQPNFSDALISSAIALAMAYYVAVRVHFISFCLFAFGVPALAVLIFSLFFNYQILLLGAFPSIFALIAVYTKFQFDKLRSEGKNVAPAFSIAGILTALNILFALISGWHWLWVNELFAFLIGIALTFCLNEKGIISLKTLRDRVKG